MSIDFCQIAIRAVEVRRPQSGRKRLSGAEPTKGARSLLLTRAKHF